MGPAVEPVVVQLQSGQAAATRGELDRMMENLLFGVSILTHNNGLRLGPTMTGVRCMSFV